tara:strand:+ start:40966 stop:41763 length:798 start_codon:yes stop_codon:yes gene_type:complete
MLKTRIAPTPNGHYHLGNIYNFIYTAWWARQNQAELHLRIDDHDFQRSKDIFIEEVFDVLNLLEIKTLGPKNLGDFKKKYSGQLKREHYRKKLDEFQNKFGCDCSRKDIGDIPYQGTCLQKNFSFEKMKTCLRFDCEKFHYPILWRKEDIPSYQWSSLIDDLELGTTHLIRGEDLQESSYIQASLARELGVDFITPDNMFHHSLLVNQEGEKLSKSNKASSVLPLLRSPDSRRDVIRHFSKFALGVEIDSLEELFQQEYPLKTDS